jgi:hypothetical protein
MPSPAVNFLRGRVSLLAAVLAASTGRPVFTADYYAVDGVSGKVASFIDWNDPTHTLSQSASGNQAALPAAHADFAGNLCATFDASAAAGSGTYYTSNRAAASGLWNYLHTGSGHRVSHCMSPGTLVSCFFWGTYTSGTVPAAFQSSAGGAFNDVRFICVNNAGSFAIDSTGTAGYVLNTPRFYQLRYTEGASPEFQTYTNTTQVTTGASAAAPGTGNPPSPLVLGRRPNGTIPCNMRWRDWLSGPDTPQFASAVAAYELGVNGLS